jgi:hypothetical protein
MKALALALLLPGTAWAAEPLTGAEFDAYTQGKTMTYALEGKVWGREQYLAGGKVIWAFEGEPCKHGFWREAQPGLICFSYEDAPFDLECWRFFQGEGRLEAQSTEDAPANPLAAIEETDEPLACPGPDVGV